MADGLTCTRLVAVAQHDDALAAKVERAHALVLQGLWFWV
jgi:hypothetical protein